MSTEEECLQVVVAPPRSVRLFVFQSVRLCLCAYNVYLRSKSLQITSGDILCTS